jgi:aspartokinase/homoserine dehydrogenase 1
MLNISGMYIKNVRNLISRIFSIIYKNHTKIILLTQSSSEDKIAVCILEKESERFLYSLQQEFQLELHNKLLNPFRVTNNLSVLSVIGENINKKYNIASKIFSTLGTAKINVLAIAQGSSKHSISIVVEEKYISQAVQKVHYTLFNDKKIIDVLLIGIGGIGTTLLKQILQQQKSLQQKNVEIQIRVIANSKKMLMPEKKIDLSNWENDFKNTTKIFNLDVLKKIIKNHSFLNPVIVDCTSDQLISEQYIDFLNNEFHIVTSNKKANTNKLDYYQKIRKTAFKKNKKFLYETNVGAGLPAIETLKNLRNTGDHLIRFKGILSGSLSFIFGRLEEGISLSQATKEAKKLGFTEPNPCDDLSGTDVARKLLILAREAGYKTELQDIKIEPLLPKDFTNYKKPYEFLEKLKELDPIFLKKNNKANAKNSVLRFVGTIKNTGQCSVKIEEISKNHPLYKVKNGENALAFYTNYYQPIPLILRGYGAGNNVTASGVFSDLLRILS